MPRAHRSHFSRILALVAFGPVAFAQSSSPPPTATASTPGEITPEATEAARLLFADGARLLDARRFEEARDRFRRTLAIVPSPLTRFNLAFAAQNSGHLVEAIDQYRQFLLGDRDPANAVRRREAQIAINAIGDVLARVVVTVHGTQAAELRLDGAALPLVLLGAEVPVDPVEHVIEAFGHAGEYAHATVRLGEAQLQNVVLTLAPPVSGSPSSSAVAGALALRTASSAAPLHIPAASPGAVARVRSLIESVADAPDEYGQRRWQRTIVFYAFQGVGNPEGLLGVGLRWAARPWIDFELQGGGGHPFGPGIGFHMFAGSPLSYRYGMGVLIGLSTNITEIDQGTSTTMNCQSGGFFAPIWLHAAYVQEWRVGNGFAFRFSLGVRGLSNAGQLQQSLESHCDQTTPFSSPTNIFFDTPTTDRSSIPVLPWISFDVGYAL